MSPTRTSIIKREYWSGECADINVRFRSELASSDDELSFRKSSRGLAGHGAQQGYQPNIKQNGHHNSSMCNIENVWRLWGSLNMAWWVHEACFWRPTKSSTRPRGHVEAYSNMHGDEVTSISMIQEIRHYVRG